MFIPHYSNEARQHYSFAEMKDDIDLVLSFIDYICIYNFLGGEPLLNSELKYIIDYVATNYSSRVGRIEITTNGTVELTEELLMILKKHKVLVSISDYTLCVPYKDKLDKFCNELKQHNVEFIRMQKTEWKDFGFPEEPFNYAKNEVVKHMKSCSPMFHGVNDRKVYYCHVEWGAEKAGLYRIPKCDYIDLRELNPNDENDRKKVGDYFRGESGCTYLDFCRVCGGCGADNPRAIVAGEQV